MANNRLAAHRLPLLQGGAIYKVLSNFAAFLAREEQIGRAQRALLWFTDKHSGLNETTLSRAPAAALATSLTFNSRIEAAHKILSCSEALRTIRSDRPFDLAKSEGDPKVRQAVDQAFQRSRLDKAFE